MPPKQMRPKKMQEQQQPSEMTVNVRGQKRDYYYVTTVKSMEELDSFRFKNVCIFNGTICNPRIRNVSKSFTMPCTRKKFGKGCEYELRAVRPDLESGTIHVYSHSKHNHPIMPEEIRAKTIREKELMPAANPPTIFRTADNLEWKFLRTFAEYEEMQKFRHKNQGHPNRTDNTNRKRIRYKCNRLTRNHCKFMLLTLKTTTNGYHVYKHGQHNHNNYLALIKKMQSHQNVSHQAKKNNDEEGIEEDEEKKEKHVQEYSEEYDDAADADEEEPPRDITKNIKGDLRKYHFLKTVKSLDELDKVRLENYCHYIRGKPKFSLSLIIPCRKKHFGENKCDFELRAVYAANFESGEMHVYAHSEHNHPFESIKKKSLSRNLNDLMPAVDQQKQMEDDMEEEEKDESIEEKDEDGVEEMGVDEDEEGLENEVESIEEEQQKEDEATEEENVRIAQEEGEPMKEEVGEEEEEEEDVEEELLDEQEEEEEIKQEVKEEIMKAEIMEEKLAKANGKVYKWMAGIGPNEIEGTIGDWDKLSLLKMVEMADQEIREHPDKLNLWLPWLKCAIPKCLPQIQGYHVRFKDLIKLTFN